MKNILSILVLCLFVFSCAQQNSSSKIKISGKLINSNVKEIKLNLAETDLALIEKDYFASVDKDSIFTFEITSKSNLFGRIHSGNNYHNIFLAPGDNLFIEIEGDTINYSGRGSGNNNFLYQILEKQKLNGYQQLFRDKNNLTETVKLAQVKKDKYKKVLFESKNIYKLNKDFINFMLIKSRSEYEVFLMYYQMFYTYNNKEKVDSIEIPKIYKEIKKIDSFINDDKLATSEYFYNIRNIIFSKMPKIKNLSSERWDSLKQIVMFDSLYGRTRDYAAADWLITAFNHNEYDTLIYSRFKDEINNPIAIDIVNKSYNKYLAKQKLINSPLTDEFNLTLLENDKGDTLNFATIVNKYKGKIIYLDIWSLGCGPCRASMPKSKELKEKYKNSPIEFVYLTVDKQYDGLWNEVYKVSLTEENHYRLVNGFDARLLKYMKINWVPNYMLIDKDGKLISFNALRPDDPKFENEIMQYVN